MRDYFRNRQVLGNIRQLDVVVPVGGIEFVGYSYGAGDSGTPSISLTSLTGGSDTQAREGDIVVVGTVCYGSTYATLSTSGYTQLALLLADDNYDCGMYVGYKIMGETPDTSVALVNQASSFAGRTITAYVFRNVDTTTPLDVPTTTATGINGGRPTPPAITPTTEGTVILCIGGAAQAPVDRADFTSALDNFLTFNVSVYTTNSQTVGLGTFDWVSGTYTPAQFGGNTTATTAAWCAATLALRKA